VLLENKLRYGGSKGGHGRSIAVGEYFENLFTQNDHLSDLTRLCESQPLFFFVKMGSTLERITHVDAEEPPSTNFAFGVLPGLQFVWF